MNNQWFKMWLVSHTNDNRKLALENNYSILIKGEQIPFLQGL